MAYIQFLKECESSPETASLSGGSLVRIHAGWQGIENLRKKHIACIGDERILGAKEFLEFALEQDDLSMYRAAVLAQEGWNIEKLAQWVCAYTDISESQLRTKARGGKLSEAKAILCYLGTAELGLSVREIATFLEISQPSTTAWVKNGELMCQKNAVALGSMGG